MLVVLGTRLDRVEIVGAEGELPVHHSRVLQFGHVIDDELQRRRDVLRDDAGKRMVVFSQIGMEAGVRRKVVRHRVRRIVRAHPHDVVQRFGLEYRNLEPVRSGRRAIPFAVGRELTPVIRARDALGPD
jgi:hypothetical protein